MPHKMDSELRTRLAIAKNQLIDIEHQIQKLKKQKKEELKALQKICPHSVVLEYWEWQLEPISHDFKLGHGVFYTTVGDIITYFAQRVCCVCEEKELLVFDLDEQKTERKEPPPIPDNMKFKKLSAEPAVKIPSQDRNGYCATLGELSDLTLNELLQKIRKNK